MQKIQEKVYPRSVPPADDKAQLQSIMVQNSQQGQAQQLEEALAMEQLAGSLQGAEEQMSLGNEALISRKQGGVG